MKSEKQSQQNIVNVELKNDVLIRGAWSLRITAGKWYILLNSNHNIVQIPLKTKIYLILKSNDVSTNTEKF